jgi:hypothetical protein
MAASEASLSHTTGRRAAWSFTLSVVVLAVASLVPLWAALRHNGYVNDDVFITLTFAKNLSQGNGFIYNHPPAIQGTTTPLLTLLIAGLKLLFTGVEIPKLDVYLTAFCWVGVIWTFFLFRKYWALDHWQATILGLVLIASGSMVYLGMEVYLFFFLLALCFSLFLAKKFIWAGITAGLLFLTRGEGVLALASLIIYFLITTAWREKIGLRTFTPTLLMGLGFAAPVTAWFIYAQITFGALLPNTLAAKQAQGAAGRTLPLLGRLINDWAPMWGKGFSLLNISFLNWWWLLVVAGILAACFWNRFGRIHTDGRIQAQPLEKGSSPQSALGLQQSTDAAPSKEDRSSSSFTLHSTKLNAAQPQWLLFLLWIGLYITGYTLLTVAAYWWYQLPIFFVAHIYLALGIIACVSVINRLVPKPVIAAILSAILVIGVVFSLGKPNLQTIATYPGDFRGYSYTQLGQWLRTNTRPSDSIAFVEIGYLGYYSDNRIIDLEGLILPDIVPHIAQNDMAWGFWHYQPDYFVYLPDFEWVLGGIHSDPRFAQNYQAVARLPGPNEADFVIYRRINLQ